MPPPHCTAACVLATLALTARSGRAAYVVPNVYTTSIHRAALTLDAGYEYEISTAETAAGVDPFMHLAYVTSVSPDGSQHLIEVAQNDDIDPSTGNYNARVTWTSSTTSEYQVIVRSWSTAVSGYGKVRYRRRWGAGAWSAYTDLSTSAWFGGALVVPEANKREYWTRLVQAPEGGFDDTVVYALSSTGGYGIERIIGYDDDSGAGRMSRYTLPAGKYTDLLLVGTYGNGTTGKTDVVANDKDTDTDGDTLGAGLEAELGICDSTSMPGCASVLNRQDSDHDGLLDFHEVLGADSASIPWSSALHFPAWGADPRKKDVFIEVDFSTAFAGSTTPFTYWFAQRAQTKFSVAPQSAIKNLVGDGVFLHFDIDKTGDPCPTNRKLCGAWGGGGDKTDADLTSGDFRKGKFRHLTVYPSGGEAFAPSDAIKAGLYEDVSGVPTAKAIVHETGHALGLTHGGNWAWDFDVKFGDGVINYKPTYTSLMNYAFDKSEALFDTQFNFSLGLNANADPRGASEGSSLGPYPNWTADLQDGSAGNKFRFPIALSTGRVDLNRDGVLGAGSVRGVLTSTYGSSWFVHDMLVGNTSVGSVSPGISRFGDRLVVTYAPPGLNAVRYKTTTHTGANNKGGCSAGQGRPYEPCHAFVLTDPGFAVPVGSSITGTSIDSTATTWWGTTLVVAYKTADRKIWVNAASGVNAGTGELTGWATNPVLVADDCDSGDVSLAPMYVLTAPSGAPAYPATEILSLFYTTGTGSSAVHKMRYATTALGSWTARDLKLLGGAPVPGDEAPAVAVWPGRSVTGPSYSDLGYACGAFPGRLSGATRYSQFMCYDKSVDQWRDLTATAILASPAGPPGQPSIGGRPSFAFHTLRDGVAPGTSPDAAVGHLGGDPTLGVFILAPKAGDLAPYVWVSTAVSSVSPPGTSLAFHYAERNLPQRDGVGLTLYGDRDISGLKAAGLPMYGRCRDCPPYADLEVGGIFDGAVGAKYADGNDFSVMEWGICHGIQGSTPSFCFTPAGYF